MKLESAVALFRNIIIDFTLTYLCYGLPMLALADLFELQFNCNYVCLSIMAFYVVFLLCLVECVSLFYIIKQTLPIENVYIKKMYQKILRYMQIQKFSLPNVCAPFQILFFSQCLVNILLSALACICVIKYFHCQCCT